MENYSTLEVRYDQSGSPYSVFEPGKELPEPVASTQSGFTQVDDSTLPSTSHDLPEPRRIWGMRWQKFYVLLILFILIIVGAISGGVAGGLASRQHSKQTSSGNSNNTTPNEITGQGRIFANSSLAASSLVDEAGSTIQSVFFQDSSGAIILRQWDSQTTTWKTRNLTSSLIRDTSHSDIFTYPGTPLAAASLEFEAEHNYETWVWFFTPDNGIQLVGSIDSTFTEAKISIDNLPLTVYPASESQLAVAWQGCSSDCKGNWLLAFQDQNGQIGIANASGTWHLQATLDGTVSMGSPMAIVPQQSEGGLISLRLLVENSSDSSASNLLYHSVSRGDDWQANAQRLNGLLHAYPTSQLIGTAPSNYTQQYFLELLPNGTVAGLILNDTEVVSTYQAVEFTSGPSIHFSSIATTVDSTFYGISNDEILEYQMNPSNPGSFNYVGIVYP
ncbi:hypothetical protein F4818DRAFT_180336 [Hypoxylon cercidicola]|nr:hypothetical protein F4818DRAFT_180336 [Hypoxylon cercidicola]